MTHIEFQCKSESLLSDSPTVFQSLFNCLAGRRGTSAAKSHPHLFKWSFWMLNVSLCSPPPPLFWGWGCGGRGHVKHRLLSSHRADEVEVCSQQNKQRQERERETKRSYAAAERHANPVDQSEDQQHIQKLPWATQHTQLNVTVYFRVVHERLLFSLYFIK